MKKQCKLFMSSLSLSEKRTSDTGEVQLSAETQMSIARLMASKLPLCEPRIYKLWRLLALKVAILLSLLVVGARARIASLEQGQPMALSLRHVLVPMFGGISTLERPHFVPAEEAGYSPNNRGFVPKSGLRFGDRRRAIDMFGEKRSETKRADSLAWSQPDPRKTYSLPSSLAERVLRGASGVKKLDSPSKMGEPATRRISSWRQSDRLDGANQTIPADEEMLQATWRAEQQLVLESDPSARRRSPSPSLAVQPNMITLVRYMPVIMSLPAEQLVLPLQTSKSAQSAKRVPVSSKLVEAEPASTAAPAQAAAYYSLYRPPTLDPGQLAKYQLGPQEEGQVQKSHAEPSAANLNWLSLNKTPNGGFVVADIDTDYSSMQQGILLQAAGQELGQSLSLGLQPAAKLAYLPAQPVALGGQGSSSATSKALSAYASKLISMLRPSALLSSMGGGPQSQLLAPNQAAVYPLAGQPQIILLAPADRLVSATQARLAQPSLRPSSSSSHKPDELLIHQASKLHSTASGAKLQQQQGEVNPLLGQQQSGLICVHGLVQGAGKLAAHSGAKLGEANSWMGHSLLRTLSTLPPPPPPPPFLSQQLLTTSSPQSLGDIEVNPFDYGPSAAGAATTPAPTKIGLVDTKSSSYTQHQYQTSAGRESPAKVALKLSRKLKHPNPVGHTSSYSISETQQQQAEGFDEPQPAAPQIESQNNQQQLRLLGSASENRSSVEGGKFVSSANQNGTRANGTKPATEELASDGGVARLPANGSHSIIPFTIRDKIDLPRKRPHPREPASPGAGGNPVEYDEPAEGEIELQALQDRKYGWPPRWSDARRAKTSFVSKSSRGANARRPTKYNSDIDYRKEQANSQADGGYTLPLLLASSSSSRDRSSRVGGGPSGEEKPLPSFMRPSVVFNGPSGQELGASASTELAGAASNSVTTSSTLDGLPVTLASGMVAASGGRQQAGGSSSSSSEPRLTLISSVSLDGPVAGSGSGGTTLEPEPARQRTSAATVELVVNSTPEVAATSTAASASQTQANRNKAEADNHAQVESGNSAFSDDTLGSAHNSLGEFAKISESLQTNPLDLIDLQNSRSSFELPAQLESLSMLFPASKRHEEEFGEPAASQSRPPPPSWQMRAASRGEQNPQSWSRISNIKSHNNHSLQSVRSS